MTSRSVDRYASACLAARRAVRIFMTSGEERQQAEHASRDEVPRKDRSLTPSLVCSSPAQFDIHICTLEPTCMVHRYKVFLHIRSVFEWSQSYILILARNPDIRSARLYGHSTLDKTWTLQAGLSVEIYYVSVPR